MNRRQFIYSATTATTATALGLARPLLRAERLEPSLRLPGAPGPFSIWDCHCHLTAPGRTPAERMATMVKAADRLGIERMCISMVSPLVADPTPEQLRRTNDEVLAVLKEWNHRAFGFVYVNPKYGRESLDELERCVANGPMVGVKFWQGRKSSSLELDPIVRRAAELQAVMLHHTWFKRTGNGPEEPSPADLMQLSLRHPKVRMICGHTGGDWEMGVRTIRAHPELYADMAGFDPTAGAVEMAVRELGANRVLFGSDAGGRSFSSQLGKILGAAISREEKQLILRDNLRNLLLPILRAKGIEA